MSDNGTSSNTPTTADLLDHEYDGIREYDNPTPGWWHALFFLSVVFSAFYAAFWHSSPIAWTVEEAWQARQVAEYKRVFGAVGELKPDQATIVSLMSNGELMAVAQSIFLTNCVACHGRDGGGINGVNLTDDHYKNAKTITDLYQVITAGAANGAMPAWGQRLSENERVILAAYAARLRGTTPATPKPPEGEVIPPWPAAAAKTN